MLIKQTLYGAAIAFISVAIAGAISGYQPVGRGVVMATLIGGILGILQENSALCLGNRKKVKQIKPSKLKEVFIEKPRR